MRCRQHSHPLHCYGPSLEHCLVAFLRESFGKCHGINRVRLMRRDLKSMRPAIHVMMMMMPPPLQNVLFLAEDIYLIACSSLNINSVVCRKAQSCYLSWRALRLWLAGCLPGSPVQLPSTCKAWRLPTSLHQVQVGSAPLSGPMHLAIIPSPGSSQVILSYKYAKHHPGCASTFEASDELSLRLEPSPSPQFLEEAHSD